MRNSVLGGIAATGALVSADIYTYELDSFKSVTKEDPNLGNHEIDLKVYKQVGMRHFGTSAYFLQASIWVLRHALYHKVCQVKYKIQLALFGSVSR